ncbi:MAG: NADPH-dependent FMN reductase, partial [Chlamydiia bacterium]
MLKSICFFLCLSWGAALGAQTKVLALAGSSRTESLNKKLVQNAARVARELGAEVRVIDLKEYPIPLYDGDLEASDGMPVNAKTIRRLMIDSQVILIASPEYNASVSGLLKNVIDWASRSEEGGWSLEAFEGKRFALMSASTGSRGGAKGLAHLRTILENVGGVVMSQQVAVPR